METLQQSYHIVQRQRSALLSESEQAKAGILLQVLEDGIRILHIQLNENRICGLDEIRFTRILSHSEKLEQFRQFIPESLLSEAPFSRITIAVDSPSFSLCPAELFCSGLETELLGVAGNFHPEDVVHSETLADGLVLIFTVPVEWKNWATGVFLAPEVKWTSNFSGMLNYAVRDIEQEDCLLAHIGPRFMYVFGRSQNKLCFFNRFQYQTEHDLLYFFLLSMEQSGLDPEKNLVLLCGSIMSGSAGFEKISRYAGNLQFAVPSEVHSDLPPASGIRHPQYFDLLSLLENSTC